MFSIEIAKLVISIDNRYEYIKERCRDYITQKKNPDIRIVITDEMIEEYASYVDSKAVAEYYPVHYTLYRRLHHESVSGCGHCKRR